jgi:hypothetical protein
VRSRADVCAARLRLKGNCDGADENSWTDASAHGARAATYALAAALFPDTAIAAADLALSERANAQSGPAASPRFPQCRLIVHETGQATAEGEKLRSLRCDGDGC